MGIRRFDVDEHGDINQTEDGIFVNANDHFREITRLRAELAAKSKDAERYRWLRENGRDRGFSVEQDKGAWVHTHAEKSLDKAIDAAMGEGNGR